MTDASFAAAGRAPWWFRLPLAREAVLCTGLATTVASLLVWLGPPGGDLAAHEYQRSLFLLHGFTLWDNFWYAGRYAFVGYSVLYYPLAALLGIQLLGVITVAVAAGAFALVVKREWGEPARWSARSFAVVWPGVLLAGEFPFALGAALALLTLAVLQRGRRWTAAGLVILVLAASPVAFVLLAVVLAGIALARPHAIRGKVVPLLAVVVTAAIELVVMHLFPTGTLEFPGIEALEATAFCVGLLVLAWRPERTRGLRGVLVVYLLAVIAVYSIPTGLGHDITRLRQFALPVALLVVALRRWRPLPLALAAVLLAGAWNIIPMAGGWAQAAADRSSRPAVWTAPVEYLNSHLSTGYRVEAVDTSQHWPSLYLARADIPLVRGWFRQDDRPVATLLYGHYTAAQYIAWLHRLGVKYVVLTRSPSDYTSRYEAALIRGGHSGLRQVFATAEVSIYAVPRPQTIVTGPGRPVVLALRQSRLAVRVSRGGTYRIAVRWSPYWHASAGCLARGAGRMLQLRTARAETVRIGFDIDARSLFDAFAGSSTRCS